MKRVILFFFVTGLTGFSAVLASMLGRSVSHAGLFIGAVLGGLIGVCLAVRLSKTLGLINRPDVRPGILGGCIGFLLAAPLAAVGAHTPVVPVLSAGLVGIGTLFSLAVSHRIGQRPD